MAETTRTETRIPPCGRVATIEQYACPICGDRLHLWSREMEDDPWLVTDACVFHHACLVTLKEVMVEYGLSDSERGAREGIAILEKERHDDA